MNTQMDLLSPLEPAPLSREPSGSQHLQVLVALLDLGRRGGTGEEVAQRAGIRHPSSATTRMEEMSIHQPDKFRDRFPVPLVYRSERKERATSSGRLAMVWRLTDAGIAFVSNANRRSA